MTTSIGVPINLPVEVIDPLTLPRITALADQLEAPGLGLVPVLHAYVLGWFRVEHEICRQGLCFATFCGNGSCCITGRAESSSGVWMLDAQHVQAIEVALAVRRLESGPFEIVVARVAADASIDEVLVPFLSDDPVDFGATLTACDGEIAFEYERSAPKPNSAVTRLLRGLVLPAGWERHPEREADPFERARQAAAQHYPNSFDTDSEGNDDPWEPERVEALWP